MDVETKKKEGKIDIKYTKALKFIWEEQKLMLKKENLVFDFFVNKKNKIKSICDTKKSNRIQTSFTNKEDFKNYFENIKKIEKSLKKTITKKNFQINWSKVENYRKILSSEEVK